MTQAQKVAKELKKEGFEIMENTSDDKHINLYNVDYNTSITIIETTSGNIQYKITPNFQNIIEQFFLTIK